MQDVYSYCFLNKTPEILMVMKRISICLLNLATNSLIKTFENKYLPSTIMEISPDDNFVIYITSNHIIN